MERVQCRSPPFITATPGGTVVQQTEGNQPIRVDCRQGTKKWLADFFGDVSRPEWWSSLAQNLVARGIFFVLVGGAAIFVVVEFVPFETQKELSNIGDPYDQAALAAPSRPVDEGIAPSQSAASTRAGLFIVPPCENQPSRLGRSGSLADACRSLLEDAITQQGGRVVERQKLDAILEETAFQQYSGSVDVNSAVKMGKMFGAQYLAIGTVINQDLQKKSFNGYGIRTNSLVYTVSLRLRVVDLQSGEIAFSGSAEGTATETSSRYGGSADADGFFIALKHAVQQLKLNSLFK
jgi:curli biogenesis system outer membrane secretion channel CsgG